MPRAHSLTLCGAWGQVLGIQLSWGPIHLQVGWIASQFLTDFFYIGGRFLTPIPAAGVWSELQHESVPQLLVGIVRLWNL